MVDTATKKVSPTSIRFDPELLKRARHACVELDISFQDFVEQALAAKLAKTSDIPQAAIPANEGSTQSPVLPQELEDKLNENPSTSGPQLVISSPYSSEFAELHEKLERILKGRVAVEAITKNIESFDLLTRLVHGQGGPDPEKAGLDLNARVERLHSELEEIERLRTIARDAEKGRGKPKTAPRRKASGGGHH